MKKLLVRLVLAGAIGAAYFNAVGNEFVFDDYQLVVENSLLRNTQPLTQMLSSPVSLGYRPLRSLSYFVDVRLGGMHPWVFHVGNLIYHWLCACFVFFIVLRLTNPLPARQSEAAQTAASGEAAWRWRVAFFAAALWALHPVLTDAVTYISGRRDILGGLGLFCGFWAYLRFRAIADQESRKYGWLLLACIAYGLGILSKESAIVLPVLCWLYDVQQEGITTSLRRRWTIYLSVLLIGAVVLWVFAGTKVIAAYDRATLYGGSIEGHVATVARIWFHYLGLMVFPHTLLADYSYNAFPASLSLWEPEAITALVGLVSVAGGLAFLARQFPFCGYGGWWMLVSILPVSHLIPIKEIAAEHYLYVPLFGFCLIFGVLLDALCGAAVADAVPRARLRTATVYGLVLCLLVAAGWRTVGRNRDWANEETFWSVVTRTAPQSARGHYNLAGLYKRQRRVFDAAREFTLVLALVPRHADAFAGLGELAFESGQYGQALGYAVQAHAIAAQNPRAVYLLSWVRLALKDFDKAEELFLQAASLTPNSPGVYAGLEAVAKERGDKEAEARWAEKRRMLEAQSGKMG